jgi:hypothetical protein
MIDFRIDALIAPSRVPHLGDVDKEIVQPPSHGAITASRSYRPMPDSPANSTIAMRDRQAHDVPALTPAIALDHRSVTSRHQRCGTSAAHEVTTNVASHDPRYIVSR